jgi:hypothetical protein
MFVLPFFDTQLFLDDCFFFPSQEEEEEKTFVLRRCLRCWCLNNRRTDAEKFKRSFWYDYVRYGMRSFMLYIVAAAPLDGIAGGL